MHSSQAISPPSLDKNYIIAACDLIFLKEHFEVSFPLLLFLFPLCLTCFNVTMTHIKSPGTPPLRYAILQCNSSPLTVYENILNIIKTSFNYSAAAVSKKIQIQGI